VRTQAVRFDVARLRPQDEHAAVVALARAFHDDPLFNFMMPNHLSQARGTLTFMHSLIADAMPFDEVWVARAGDGVVGVAAWLPPGAYPRSAWRDVRKYARDLRSALRLGPRMRSGMRLDRALIEAHARVPEPHWYLSLLATDPSWQRRGVGTALLAPVLERCDDRRELAYLETQKAANVPWYGRHGFDLVEQLSPPDCPSMWLMLRDPARAAEHRGL